MNATNQLQIVTYRNPLNGPNLTYSSSPASGNFEVNHLRDQANLYHQQHLLDCQRLAHADQHLQTARAQAAAVTLQLASLEKQLQAVQNYNSAVTTFHQAWQTAFASSYSTLTDIPEPPHALARDEAKHAICMQQQQRKRLMNACACDIAAAFEAHPNLIKLARVKFHPDRFSTCVDASKKAQIQKKATEGFLVVDELYQRAQKGGDWPVMD